MNIAKSKNIDLSTAYNNIMDSVPIYFITIAIFVIAVLSLLILFYIKFFYSKNLSDEQKESVLNKKRIKFLVGFCITVVMFAFGLVLIKSIFWLSNKLPFGSGVLVVALVGLLILWKWKWFLNKED
jgi:Na+/H+ antiporter NhaD/arsenite permease-like protein